MAPLLGTYGTCSNFTQHWYRAPDIWDLMLANLDEKDRKAILWERLLNRLMGKSRAPKTILPLRLPVFVKKSWRLIFQPCWSCLRWKSLT
jgi:hypothetical protein